MSNSAKKVPGGNDKERLQSVFDYFDADGNGSIDVNELRQIIRGLGNNPTEVPAAACRTRHRGHLQLQAVALVTMG